MSHHTLTGFQSSGPFGKPGGPVGDESGLRVVTPRLQRWRMIQRNTLHDRLA